LSDLNRAQGETDAAWAHIRAMLPSGPETPAGALLWFIGPPLLRGAAALAMDEGDLSSAERWLDAHDRWLAWSDAALGRSEGQALWAQFHRQAADMDAAREHAERALAHATAPRQPLALLAAHRLLGELDTDTGRLAKAAAHLAASLALSDACQAPYERALTLLAQARLHVTSGSAMEAATAFAQARVICIALGALPSIARIDALAASLAEPASPDGMTGREVEVLRHIAAGESNREIAAALSVSVRTVERHIENLYRKIDARSKADATAYAFRHRLA
jgi:DNA-binding NarL/FixJ family response regulator